MPELIFVVVLIVGMIGFMVLFAWRAVAIPKRYERRVRDWARENGYAILDIRNRGRIFAGFGVPFCSGQHAFELRIQDDQGGQTTITVLLARPDGPVEVRWG